MDYSEYGFGAFTQDIVEVARRFNLNLPHLKVEFFNPGHQGIFVETVGERTFRIHVSLEEGRIIAVKQISGPAAPTGGPHDLFAKYKSHMK